MSTTVGLLSRIEHKLPRELEDLLHSWHAERAKVRAAKKKEEKARKAVRANCPHSIVLQTGKAPRQRSCYFCGLTEIAPVADPGDEYYYATYGEFKVLTGGDPTRGYQQPTEGREIFVVEPREFSQHWIPLND